MLLMNNNDPGDDNSESDSEPLLRSSRKAMGKQPGKDFFMSTLQKQVVASQLALM
jgi:hypothetical protein